MLENSTSDKIPSSNNTVCQEAQGIFWSISFDLYIWEVDFSNNHFSSFVYIRQLTTVNPHCVPALALSHGVDYA